MKKKVVHLIQSLNSGGCENMLLRTLPLMKNTANLIVVLKEKGELADKFEEKNIPIVQINLKSLLDLGGWLRLYKIVGKYKPDLVITYLFHADFIGRIFLQNFGFKIIPFLRTTYDYPRYKFIRLFEKLTSWMTPRYLANSEAIKKYYENKLKVKPEKFTIIPNGIDVSVFDRAKKQRKNFRSGMEIKDKEMVVVCVANLHPNKGHKYLLEAFEKLYQKNKNIWLWLVGTGIEKENLENQIKHYNSKKRIKFLGRRDDIPLILGASDIFAMPTLFEGMSNSLMEAMVAGLPVITTDIPENRQLIIDKKTGFLVRTESSKEITECFERIIQNEIERKKIGDQAKKTIIERFELKKIALEFEKFLNKNDC